MSVVKPPPILVVLCRRYSCSVTYSPVRSACDCAAGPVRKVGRRPAVRRPVAATSKTRQDARSKHRP